MKHTNSRNKATPGPWTEHHNLIEDATGRNILAIIDYTQSGYVRANARLIAAAPDLMEACKSILAGNVDKGTYWIVDRADIEKVIQAIAKAEGKV